MITLEKIDDSFAKLRASDAILAKALKISALAQTYRIESKLREYFLKKWNALRREASEKASRLVRSGKSPKDVERMILSIMGDWSSEVKRQLTTDVERIYRLGRESIWAKARRAGVKPVEKAKPKKPSTLSLVPRFDMRDKDAIRALQEQQLFWISEVDGYEKEIASKIRDVTESVILEGGGDRIFAGKELKDEVDRVLGYITTPSGYTGSVESYFEGLAAAASTSARTQGQIRSLQELEIERYVIVNPEDARTCPICSELNGKSFTVEIGGEVVDDVLSAETPDEVKEAQPFVNFNEIEGLDSEELAAKGIVLPPFHFNCRCNVDIDLGSLGEE